MIKINNNEIAQVKLSSDDNWIITFEKIDYEKDLHEILQTIDSEYVQNDDGWGIILQEISLYKSLIRPNSPSILSGSFTPLARV